MEKVIKGKSEEIELVLVALLCEGHILVEDLPGVGKTMLARAVARSMGLSFSRIQFTPDLLPSDITGVNIFNQQTRDFEFRPGPIHNQIVLADEINRGTPKTQSALLEGMEERQVTVDGTTYELKRPFLVIATQNPIEYEGTFPLPESQLDRFFIKISMGYPDEISEVEILSMQKIRHPIEDLQKVVSLEEIREMQEKTKEILFDEALRKYVVRIVNGTRDNENLYMGASPRGSLSLFKAAQAQALIRDRDYVTPDDIKKMAPHTLGHRIISKSDNFSAKNNAGVIQDLLEEIPVPE